MMTVWQMSKQIPVQRLGHDLNHCIGACTVHEWSISFCGCCVYSADTIWNVVIKLLGMFQSCTHEVIERARDIPKPIIICAIMCLYFYFHVCVYVCVFVLCVCQCVLLYKTCLKGVGASHLSPCEPPQPAGDTPWSGLLIRRERKNGESVEPPYLVHCF